MSGELTILGRHNTVQSVPLTICSINRHTVYLLSLQGKPTLRGNYTPLHASGQLYTFEDILAFANDNIEVWMDDMNVVHSKQETGHVISLAL